VRAALIFVFTPPSAIYLHVLYSHWTRTRAGQQFIRRARGKFSPRQRPTISRMHARGVETDQDARVTNYVVCFMSEGKN
jgi:hypothetical protein